MITTDSGAKKIEGTDNWRGIFDAQNATAEAVDQLTEDMAIIVVGNKTTHTGGAAAGQFVLVRNSTITDITDGIYTAAQAIPANTVIDKTYLTAVSGGGLNALNNKLEYYQNGETIPLGGKMIFIKASSSGDSMFYDVITPKAIPSGASFSTPNKPAGCFKYDGSNFTIPNGATISATRSTDHVIRVALSGVSPSANCTYNISYSTPPTTIITVT